MSFWTVKALNIPINNLTGYLKSLGHKVPKSSVAEYLDRSKMLVQACESLAETQTKKRETAAPGEAMAELKIASAVVVTRNEDGEISTERGKIAVIPVRRFLLELTP